MSASRRGELEGLASDSGYIECQRLAAGFYGALKALAIVDLNLGGGGPRSKIAHALTVRAPRLPPDWLRFHVILCSRNPNTPAKDRAVTEDIVEGVS